MIAYLAGLKIVVTRPRDQAAQLARSIEQAGGIPLLFPLLDITAVQDNSVLNEQIARLVNFNLAIFISPNAVNYGIAAIRAVSKIPQTLRIATVGQGSAKALRELGIADIIAPTARFDSEGLLALPELQNVAGWQVMIFRGESGRELLGETLNARGAMVEYATCYRRSKPQMDASMLLAAAPQSDQKALRNTPLFVPHARIAGLARDQGWAQVQVTASGDDGMLSALITWAHRVTENKGQRK